MLRDSRCLLRSRMTLAAMFGLFCLLMLPSAPFAQPSEWQFEVVENGKQFGNMTEQHMVLDAQGHPHIAYGGDWLYYTWYDGTTWHYEVADSTANVGEYACIALDSQGYPHISYFREYAHDLMYAFKDETGWHAQTVEGSTGGGEYNSLELDWRGYPHISYEGYGLKYAYWDGTTWHIEVADQAQPNCYPGYYTSLELDVAGWPHVSYYVSGGFDYMDLRHAYKDASGWHKETVDNLGRVGKFSSLELDAAGYPHISYYDETDSDLKYASRDASGWHRETVYSQGEAGWYTSLELDEEGYPHISFYGTGDLKYAYQDAPGWHVETVGPGETIYTALELNPDGYPEISYYLEGALKHARRLESGWSVATVDTLGSGGQHTHLAIGSGGNLHASYWWNAEIRYAWQDPSGWHLDLIQTPEYWTSGFGFALDYNDCPHLFYGEDDDYECVFHAYKAGSCWETETLTQGVEWPFYPSAAFDTSGYAHIAYGEDWADQVIHGYEDAAGWHFEVADPGRGDKTTIQLDGWGYPHLTFGQIGQGIVYCHKDAQGWHSETLGQPDPAIWSLALDGEGRPHVSCCMGSRLWYACRDSSGWQFEDVDAQGQYSSIQLDPTGYPHIAYWAVETDNLKYAVKDASGWHIQTVDPGPGVGTWATLVLDQGWYPNIIYRRPALADVKRAWIPTPSTINLAAMLVGGAVTLTWSPVEGTTGYWVYGASDLPWFVPGGAPGYDFRLDVLPVGNVTWSSPNGVGDPLADWTYLVIAVDVTESELARSNRVGEQDYDADIP